LFCHAFWAALARGGRKWLFLQESERIGVQIAVTKEGKAMKRAISLFILLSLPGMVFCQQFAVTSPQGGEKWSSESKHNITWTFSGIPGGTQVKLLLFRNGVKVGTIAENVAIGSNGAGTYLNWPAGTYVGGKADIGDGYQVRIRDMNNQFPYAMSPGMFSITMIHMQASVAQTAVQTKPHPIHSSGTVTIRFNRYCDLDTGYEVTTVPGCDFWWSQNSIAPYQRVLIPNGGAKFKALGIWAEYTYQSLRSGSGYSDNLLVDSMLPLNMVVGYLTDQMRSGAFRVVAKGDDGSFTIAWVTYDQ
jgi:hypothetical protein